MSIIYNSSRISAWAAGCHIAGRLKAIIAGCIADSGSFTWSVLGTCLLLFLKVRATNQRNGWASQVMRFYPRWGVGEECYHIKSTGAKGWTSYIVDCFVTDYESCCCALLLLVCFLFLTQFNYGGAQWSSENNDWEPNTQNWLAEMDSSIPLDNSDSRERRRNMN